MHRLAIFIIILFANTVAYGQLARKPQTPTPEPLIREAFMPKGTEVLLSYPMEGELDGEQIWRWRYHKRKLSDLSVTNALGEELTDEQIRNTLKKPTIVLLSRDGEPIHPYYLKVIKPDTLVIVDSTPIAEPEEKPRPVIEQSGK